MWILGPETATNWCPLLSLLFLYTDSYLIAAYTMLSLCLILWCDFCCNYVQLLVTRLCWFSYTNITYFTFKIFCFWCINSVQTHFISIYAFSIITTASVIDFLLHYHIKLTQNLPKYLFIHYNETKEILNVQRSNKWHKCNSNFFPGFFFNVYDNFIEMNNSLSRIVIY